MALRVDSSGSDRPSELRVRMATPPPPSRRERKPPSRPASLQLRLLGAVGVALFAFLGLTGFALEQAFYESSIENVRDRLQNHVSAFLAGSDVSVGGKVILPEYLPEPRFNRPQSGLYAAVVGNGVRWISRSALGHEMPFETELERNSQRFVGPVATPLGEVFLYSRTVLWEIPGREDLKLTFHVAEGVEGLNAQVEVFRRTLWTWLLVVAVALLVAEIMILRWSLRPLRRVSKDLTLVERGVLEQMPGGYPHELEGLTTSLNAFIDSEREQRTRYRNTLSDLAHSLKTPLAVISNELESGAGDARAFRTLVNEQVERMDEIVAYQLSRAATSGHKTFAAPIELLQPAEEVVQSLEKVYADRQVLCEFELDPGARFYGELGDLMELLGNLLENAFKWARHRVELTARCHGPTSARRRGLEIVVEDDGPGIPPDQVERMLQRGVRGDERVQGHGIGLSIVQDIVRAYRAELDVGKSDSLGGAKFTIRFQPVA
jgi:two-component system, OmpR family, sensor histidine kinase PhoQ